MNDAASHVVTASTRTSPSRVCSRCEASQRARRRGQTERSTRFRHRGCFGASAQGHALVSPLRHRGHRGAGSSSLRVFRGTDDSYPSTVRLPLPFPDAIGVGLQCAVSGARTALASPSQAWKPFTGAVLGGALALDVGGFFLIARVLSPADDANGIAKLVSELAMLTTDGACLLLAPLVSFAVVQQALPLLGEKIFFDGARAAVDPSFGGGVTGGNVGDTSDEDDVDSVDDAKNVQLTATETIKEKLRAVSALESANGLGLRGIGAAASRTQALATLTAATIPIGAVVTFVPVAGPLIAAFMATLVASYALAWELLDPYFDKKNLVRLSHPTHSTD